MLLFGFLPVRLLRSSRGAQQRRQRRDRHRCWRIEKNDNFKYIFLKIIVFSRINKTSNLIFLPLVQPVGGALCHVESDHLDGRPLNNFFWKTFGLPFKQNIPHFSSNEEGRSVAISMPSTSTALSPRPWDSTKDSEAWTLRSSENCARQESKW